MVAAAGATPWPQMASALEDLAAANRIGTSPPGPFRWGSTTCSTNPAATAASNALPPRSSTAMPAELASQWVEATQPKLPRISGRVVNMEMACLAGFARTDYSGGQQAPARLRAAVIDDYATPTLTRP